MATGPDEIGTSENDLGVLLHMRGRDAEATQWLARAFAQWKLNNRINAAASSGHSLATVLRTTGNYAEAERVAREALAPHPASQPAAAMLRNLLGDILREQGRLAEAREYAEAALAITGIPWKVFSDSVMLMADVQRESGQFQPAIGRLTALLQEARLRNDTVIEAVALRGLGETQMASGDLASATLSLRKALAIFEAAQNSHQVASTLSCLSEIYIREMKPAMAEEALRRAIDLDENSMGVNHPQLAVLLQMRADAASRQGAAERARNDLDRAWPILENRFGPRSAVMGAYLANRGIIEERAGENDAAALHFQSATSILRDAGPETRGVAAVLSQHYANVLRHLHRNDQAKAVLAEAKSFRSH